jgi:hypothetical protein
MGATVHLFVRRRKKIANQPAPFVYCGPVEFVDWEHDAPITVRWRLPQPVPESLREALCAPGPGDTENQGRGGVSHD